MCDSGKQADTLHKTILGAIRNAVMVTDLKGYIAYVNPAFEKLHGYPAAEVIGRTPELLKSDHHNAAFYDEIIDTLRRGLVWEGTVHNRCKNGSTVMVEVILSPVYQSGAPKFYLATMHAFEMKSAHAVKGKKAPRTLDTMAAGLAHDLNNLMSPLLGYAELAVMKIENGTIPEKEVDQILRAGTRAKELAQQVLTFCRQDSTEIGVIFLDGIIKDVVSLQQVNLPEDIHIETRTSKNCGVILGEPIQMHQVLMNLCSNALHAMRDGGGRLTVSLDSLEVNVNSAYATDLPHGSYLRLSVKDTGCGMDKHTMKMAFDPFFTLKGKGEGAGLGLAMVQDIVRDHGGEVYVESELGQGSEFYVILPRYEKLEANDSKAPIEGMPPGRGTIMLVDDEQVIVQMGKSMLEYMGFNVVGLTGGQQALERFQTGPDDFDLIITDQVMPGMQGHELVKAIRQLRSEIPVVFVTGFSHRLPKEEVATLGNCETLEKPFSTSGLIEAVQRLLAQ